MAGWPLWIDPGLLRRHCCGGAEGGILCRRCPLKWKIHDPCLFQVEFAFYAPSSFIGDLAVLQQPVDVFSLGGDQFRPELCRSQNSFEFVRRRIWQPYDTIVVTE